MEHMIGERQRWAWLAAGLSGAAASGICGFSWMWVLTGGLAVTIYYIVLDRKLDTDGLAVLFVRKLGVGGKILCVLTLIWTIVVMGWAAGLADTAFPMVDGVPGLGWILLALAAWGSEKGAGACARCCGVLCLFLIALYGTILVFALPDVEWTWILDYGPWQEALWSAGLFLLPAGVWFVPCSRERKGPAWQMAFLLPGFAAALAAVTAGVLSPELAGVRKVPLYDLTQSISVFGVVERIEPLLSAAMTMGIFALLSGLTCACQGLLDQLRPWKWNGAAAAAGAGALVVLLQDLPVELLALGAVLFWGMIPLVVVLLGKKN